MTRRNFWPIDRVRAEASKFATRGDFAAKARSAHCAALRYGIMDELFRSKPNNGYSNKRLALGSWTKERVMNAARECESVHEFRRRFASAYASAHNHGWWTEVRALLVIRRRDPYTRDEVFDLARQHAHRNAFRKEHPGAYMRASKSGWLDDACAHMTRQGSRRQRIIYKIWNDETREVYIGLTFAVQRRYRQHLANPSSPAMAKLLAGPHQVNEITGLLDMDEAAAEEIRIADEFAASGWKVLNARKPGHLGANSRRWDKASLHAIAMKCTSRTEFYRRHRTAYAAAIRLGLLDDLFSSHASQGYTRRHPGYWTFARIKELASAYATRSDMMRAGGEAASAYSIAAKQDILDAIFCDHPNDGLSSNCVRRGHWTLATLKDVASRYDDRRALEQGDRKAYAAAKRLGLLDHLFASRPDGGLRQKRAGYWTEDRLRTTAKRYRTRREMKTKDRKAYAAAVGRGLLDSIFADHPRRGYSVNLKRSGV